MKHLTQTDSRRLLSCVLLLSLFEPVSPDKKLGGFVLPKLDLSRCKSRRDFLEASILRKLSATAIGNGIRGGSAMKTGPVSATIKITMDEECWDVDISVGDGGSYLQREFLETIALGIRATLILDEKSLVKAARFYEFARDDDYRRAVLEPETEKVSIQSLLLENAVRNEEETVH